MIQTDLLDWLDSKKIILALPPAQSTQQRTFLINQLKPIMREMERLELSPLAISEALAYYSNYYQEAAQAAILEEKAEDCAN